MHEPASVFEPRRLQSPQQGLLSGCTVKVLRARLDFPENSSVEDFAQNVDIFAVLRLFEIDYFEEDKQGCILAVNLNCSHLTLR